MCSFSRSEFLLLVVPHLNLFNEKGKKMSENLEMASVALT